MAHVYFKTENTTRLQSHPRSLILVSIESAYRPL